MNLQESCYLEVYNHVYEEIKRKEQAQIKIRKDGGSLSVCQILIRFQDFNCVAHNNS
jgi:hypothetical protein